MPGTYILSNENRLYAAVEASYGRAPTITSANRFPAVKLTAKQQVERPERRDKTGTRTFLGAPSGLRKRTRFEVKSYLTSWLNPLVKPGYGALFESAMGQAALTYSGGTAAAGSGNKILTFAAAHGLQPGQAVSCGGEMRFVVSLVDTVSVEINAPFSAAVPAGTPIGATVSYRPGKDVPSVSIFDYWDAANGVQRVICGAAVNKARLAVNEDYHEFQFAGVAQDVIDSASFQSGQGELTSFPAEPAASDFDYSIIPGHQGQVWLGNVPSRFHTLTSGEVVLENNVELRDHEYGAALARGISPGPRSVELNIALHEQNDTATRALYQAARQNSPISVMFQLGSQTGQLFGVYLKSVAPGVPEYDDGETLLQWRFSGCRAQGTGNDEVFVAFG